MILLPTRGRPQSLARFINAYRVTGASLPVQVVIDKDDYEHYAISGLVFPEHWPQPLINPEIRDLNAAFNLGFAAHPEAQFYGIMADDIVPESEGWDVRLLGACLEHHIAWGDDGIRQSNALTGPALCTHPFISGRLARAWGWLLSPYTNRHCQDLIWRDFAEALGVGQFLPEVHTRHYHWQTGQAAFDTTYAIQPSPRIGEEQYKAYKGSEQFQKEVKRVKETLGI